MKILFATDIHGSNRLVRKLCTLVRQTGSDALLIGGDVSGKFLAPIVESTGGWRVPGQGRALSDQELISYERAVQDTGGYPVRLQQNDYTHLEHDADYQERLLRDERVLRLRQLYEIVLDRLAAHTLFLNLGNDDPYYLDSVPEECGGEAILEHRNVEIAGGFIIVSCGFANVTPWQCPRDVDEAQLAEMLERKFQGTGQHNVIANLHCPPINSALDRAPKIDKNLSPIVGPSGVEFANVGSTAVRAIIERYQPTLSLHGHVHEAYAKDRIGRTICVNPGSQYTLGEVRAALIHLDGNSLSGVQLIRER